MSRSPETPQNKQIVGVFNYQEYQENFQDFFQEPTQTQKEMTPHYQTAKNIKESQVLKEITQSKVNNAKLKIQHKLKKYERIFIYQSPENEILTVARQTLEEYKKYQNKAIFYRLTNCLVRLSSELFKKGFQIPEIERQLKKILTTLKQEYPPAFPLKFSKTFIQQPISFSQTPSKTTQIDFSRCWKYKQLNIKEPLQNDIKEHAHQASKQLQAFRALVEGPCLLHHGFHFKSGLKIRSEGHSKAINRVIEKLFKGTFRKFLEANPELDPKTSFENFFKRENAYVEQQLEASVKAKGNVWPWTVSDLVRGKIYFKDLNSLLECNQYLLQSFKGTKHQIFRLKNRLEDVTADILINFLIEDTFCQLQLAMEGPEVNNEFNHLLYELERSSLFSILSTLHNLNEEFRRLYDEWRKVYKVGQKEEVLSKDECKTNMTWKDK